MRKDTSAAATSFPHYSGSNSNQFWSRINALEQHDKDGLYLAGILLQEMEIRILHWLEQAEIRKVHISNAAKDAMS